MSQQPVHAEQSPSTKFVTGLRAIFTTTKAESDAQMAKAASERKEKRDKAK